MKININSLITLLLPVHKRIVNRLGMLRMLLSPLITLWNNFTTYRQQSIYIAGITSQTLALENYLNYKFDATLKRIKIIHFQKPTTLVLYNRNESPVNAVFYFESEQEAPTVIKFRAEFNSMTTKDFEVMIPSGIDTTAITAEILKYKLAGKTFLIN